MSRLDGVLMVFRVCVVQFGWASDYVGFGVVSGSDTLWFGVLLRFLAC